MMRIAILAIAVSLHTRRKHKVADNQARIIINTSHNMSMTDVNSQHKWLDDNDYLINPTLMNHARSFLHLQRDNLLRQEYNTHYGIT